MLWATPQSCPGVWEAAESHKLRLSYPTCIRAGICHLQTLTWDWAHFHSAQGASRNQQDSAGTQLSSQRVHYFIWFYPERVKGWVTFLFHCFREEDLAKEATRKPKIQTLQYTNLFFTILFPFLNTKLNRCSWESHFHVSPYVWLSINTSFILMELVLKLQVAPGSKGTHPAALCWRQGWDRRDGICTGLCLTADTCNRLVLGRKVISWHFQIKSIQKQGWNNCTLLGRFNLGVGSANSIFFSFFFSCDSTNNSSLVLLNIFK